MASFKRNGSIQFTSQLLEQLDLDVGNELLCIRVAILHLQWGQKDLSLKKPMFIMVKSKDISEKGFIYDRYKKLSENTFNIQVKTYDTDKNGSMQEIYINTL